MKSLYIPCGRKPVRSENWINVDGWMDERRKTRVDAVADMRALPFRCGSFNEIYCCHGIEHIPRPDHYPALTEFRRVLAKKGILRLAVPNIEAMIYFVYNSARLKWAEDHFYGDQKEPGRFHYFAFSRKTLSRLMKDAGFLHVREWDPYAHGIGGRDDASWWAWLGDRKIPFSLNLEGVKA